MFDSRDDLKASVRKAIELAQKKGISVKLTKGLRKSAQQFPRGKERKRRFPFDGIMVSMEIKF